LTIVLVAYIALTSCSNLKQSNLPRKKFSVERKDKLNGALLGIEKYNDKFQLLESISFDTIGEIRSKTSVTYQGRYPLKQLQQNVFLDTTNFISNHEIMGDTMEVTHYKDGVIDYITKEVFQDGKIIAMLYNSDLGKSLTKIEYDRRGNLKHIIEVLNEDTIYSKNYLISYQDDKIREVIEKDNLQDQKTTYRYSYEQEVTLNIFQDGAKIKEVKSYNTIKPSYITNYEEYYFPKSEKKFDQDGNVISHIVYEYQH